MGTGPTRCYRPDLSEHFVLVHPGRQWGIVKFNSNKSKAWVQKYAFDKDGDLSLGRRQWRELHTDKKGPYVERQRAKAYIHDFVKPIPNPYA